MISQSSMQYLLPQDTLWIHAILLAGLFVQSSGTVLCYSESHQAGSRCDLGLPHLGVWKQGGQYRKVL